MASTLSTIKENATKAHINGCLQQDGDSMVERVQVNEEVINKQQAETEQLLSRSTKQTKALKPYKTLKLH